MVTPTKAEIVKKKKEYEANLAKLDSNGLLSEKWVVASLRSAIRKEWMRNPVKLAVLYEAMIPDMNPNTRTKWLFKCAICGEYFKSSDVQVDHLRGEHSFKSLSDFDSYSENILRVGRDGLQVLCLPDHEIKTLAERYNLTWNQAKERKAVIAKMKQPIPKQKKELKSFGFIDKEISNATMREQCYMKLIEEGKL